MTKAPRILAFAGSTRKQSFNRKLAKFAAEGARRAGAEVTLLELADYRLPLFEEDLESEQGPPEAATRLKSLFLEHDGLLISSPEYNSSVTPLLKNTLDWVSRAGAGQASLAAFSGKVAGLLSASPGALGGLRGLVHLRSILGNIGVLVLPSQVSIPKAKDAFEDNGEPKDAKFKASVLELSATLVNSLAKLKS